MDKRKRLTREEADAAREEAATTKLPTMQDLQLAQSWYDLLRSGEASVTDLARVFTAIRFDVALVRKLESDNATLRRDKESLEASLKTCGTLANGVGAAVRRIGKL